MILSARILGIQKIHAAFLARGGHQLAAIHAFLANRVVTPVEHAVLLQFPDAERDAQEDMRVVAAGFGEFQPIDFGKTDDAYKRNRRIEFKLTER